MARTPQDRAALVTRLRRIEGQVRGIARMIEQDAYCIDVLTQVSAATGALHAVAMGLVNDHLRECVAEASGSSSTEAQIRAKVKEVSDAVARLART